jgi:serine/threonine-protein kinase
VDTSALEPGTIIAGRYRVATKIGHGGMGAVYHVQHVHTDEALALKVLHPQVLRDTAAVDRFRREARAPARITSEHVARVTDADTAADLDGAPFYVMELLRGRDLERVLADDGPIPPPQVVEYLRQMARALDKAHAIGIVHRDLKPENLFLTHRDDGSACIKLLDFGIARLAHVEGPTMVTQVGYVFGTPNYMAPEQSMGENDQIGPATDIWAIGLVAFKLLVGQEYFTGKTAAHLYAQILSEPLPTPTERGSVHGGAFDAWFARCVARSIDQRFGSAGDAITALGDAFGIQLETRYSSASLPSVPRLTSQPAFASQPAIASQPSITNEAAVGTAPVTAPAMMTALPTGLPAGVPARTSRGKLLAIGGGVLVVVIGAGALVYALKSPDSSSYGLVAASASASASTVPRQTHSSATSTSPSIPTEMGPTGDARRAPASAPSPSPSKVTRGASTGSAAPTSRPRRSTTP